MIGLTGSPGALCSSRMPVLVWRIAPRLSFSSRARFFSTSQLTASNASTSQQHSLLFHSRPLAFPSITYTRSSALAVSLSTSTGHFHDASSSSGQSTPTPRAVAGASASSAGNSPVKRNSSSTRAVDPFDLSDLLPKSDKTSRSDGVWDSILAMSGSELLPRSNQNGRWEKHHEDARRRMADTKLEAGKYAGRSVNVTDFVPLRIALGRLGRILSQNNVRKELRLVERYEKPTDKRRRLKSERHRRRFAEMVSE